MKPQSPNLTDYAWAAGFFDGEGCVTISRIKIYKYAVITIGQTDRAVLDKFCEIAGAGKVYGPYQEPLQKNKQPVWHYRLQGQEKVKKLFFKLMPFLGDIKTQCWINVIRECESSVEQRLEE